MPSSVAGRADAGFVAMKALWRWAIRAASRREPTAGLSQPAVERRRSWVCCLRVAPRQAFADRRRGSLALTHAREAARLGLMHTSCAGGEEPGPLSLAACRASQELVAPQLDHRAPSTVTSAAQAASRRCGTGSSRRRRNGRGGLAVAVLGEQDAGRGCARTTGWRLDQVSFASWPFIPLDRWLRRGIPPVAQPAGSSSTWLSKRAKCRQYSRSSERDSASASCRVQACPTCRTVWSCARWYPRPCGVWVSPSPPARLRQPVHCSSRSRRSISTELCPFAERVV